jgi:hypothetical protein
LPPRLLRPPLPEITLSSANSFPDRRQISVLHQT